MANKMWMVRAGRNAIYANLFMEKQCVAVGWERLNDLSKVRSKDELAKLHRAAYADQKEGTKRLDIGMMSRFLFEMKPGDAVLTYNKELREYLVGEIVSDYQYLGNAVGEYRHVRRAKWKGKVSRDDMTTSTKSAIGSIMTLFLVNDEARAEIESLLSGKKPQTPEEGGPKDIEMEDLKKDTMERALEFIKDRIQKLDWSQMQELVAGILRAMGYKTRVSAGGSDRGADIIASPDGLGLEQPRIRVEVKHRDGTIGAPLLRSFIGGLTTHDRGLYVSTGGFTKEARYEAERSATPITLIDIDELADLLVHNYDNADSETKAMIPLVKLYWPA